jgi:hypothetical protein
MTYVIWLSTIFKSICMYKIKNYIGFLILLLFITGTNISLARDHNNDYSNGGPDVKEAMPLPVPELPTITSEEQRYILILNEVNRCQATIMHLAKFINIADAVLVNIDAENPARAQLTTLRDVIKERFITLNKYEEATLKKLQELETDVDAINRQAIMHFENIMGMGTTLFSGSHTTVGHKALNHFLLTILDITSECKPTIDRYLNIEIQE